MGTRPADGWELRPQDACWPSQLEGVEPGFRVLYGRGDASLLRGPMLAIIGARLATPYGLAIARMAGRVSAECGVTVVSGGALGCDHAASRAVLDAGGSSVIVPGSGADVVYPRSSEDIFSDTLSAGGCIVALERWGAPARRYAFPRRNRLIAALCQALVVCEAGIPSGTFVTANAAAELGRSVYAIPGSIFSPSSRGTNSLIESGAAIIPDEQALEARISLDFGRLRLLVQGEARPRDKLVSALVANPLTADQLAGELGGSMGEVMGTLAGLEASGIVRQLPDGRFAPTEATLLGDNA